jgi:hypothetical protein
MKKSKFANINFESVEVLSREQMSKVKGGYGGGAMSCSECCSIIYGYCGTPTDDSCRNVQVIMLVPVTVDAQMVVTD